MTYKMFQQRDNQRQRVYDAERAAFQRGQTIPNGQLQSRVDEILDKRVVRSRWGIKSVRVELGKGRGVSYGGRITLGVECRNDWVICHELAHELTPHQYAAHGPEFAGIFLFLVANVMGKEDAARLREAYRKNRVRSNRKGIPAVRQVVPAPRAQREREARNRQRSEATAQVERLLAKGHLTKADLRRLVTA